MTPSTKKNSLAKSACFCVLQSLLGEISNREHALSFQLTLQTSQAQEFLSFVHFLKIEEI